MLTYSLLVYQNEKISDDAHLRFENGLQINTIRTEGANAEKDGSPMRTTSFTLSPPNYP